MEYVHLLLFRCGSCEFPLSTVLICANRPCTDEYIDGEYFEVSCPSCGWKKKANGRLAVYRTSVEWTYRSGSGHHTDGTEGPHC